MSELNLNDIIIRGMNPEGDPMADVDEVVAAGIEVHLEVLDDALVWINVGGVHVKIGFRPGRKKQLIVRAEDNR